MFCCPTFLYLECDSLSKMYIYELWAFFLALCQREVFIYSCCRLQKWLILWLQAASSQQLEGMPKGSLCSLCEMVVSLLKPIVDSNSTEVSGGITTVCCLMICDTQCDCQSTGRSTANYECILWYPSIELLNKGTDMSVPPPHTHLLLSLLLCRSFSYSYANSPCYECSVTQL